LFCNCYCKDCILYLSWNWHPSNWILSNYSISIYIISIYYQFDKNGGCMDRLKNITYHPAPACSSLDSSIDTCPLDDPDRISDQIFEAH
jgi:hypothetical protein